MDFGKYVFHWENWKFEPHMNSEHTAEFWP